MRSASTVAPQTVWAWLAAPEHRALLTLWIEAYAQSLVDPEGPWQTFAERTVHDWLALFADLDVATDDIDRTLLLAVLRGALLDLLATRDVERTTAAVNRYLSVRCQPDQPDLCSTRAKYDGSEPAGVLRLADRVDAVAGVELGQRVGQVVAYGRR